MAVVPLPPAYALLEILAFVKYTYVFCLTIAAFPPPYILSNTVDEESFKFVFFSTSPKLPPPYTFVVWVLSAMTTLTFPLTLAGFNSPVVSPETTESTPFPAP